VPTSARSSKSGKQAAAAERILKLTPPVTPIPLAGSVLPFLDFTQGPKHTYSPEVRTKNPPPTLLNPHPRSHRKVPPIPGFGIGVPALAFSTTPIHTTAIAFCKRARKSRTLSWGSESETKDRFQISEFQSAEMVRRVMSPHSFRKAGSRSKINLPTTHTLEHPNLTSSPLAHSKLAPHPWPSSPASSPSHAWASPPRA
jgi:hypothetical protein